jgi:PEGA domain
MRRAINIVIVLSVVSRLAYAADDKAADALITKGLELRREGKALDAIDLFQKAVAIAPTPRSFGQLGLAESAIEHWSDAEDHLNVALASPQDPWVTKNHGALDQAVTLARTHIGQISLIGPAGAAIVISDKSVGSLPLRKPIRVNSGPAIVTATAPGFRQFEMSVPVEVGKETQLKIVLEPLPPSPAPVTARPALLAPTPPQQQGEPRSSWRTWTGASLLAAGGSVAAWGIIWVALDGHSSSGSCSAGAPPSCIPVYNTKTPGIIIAGVGAAAAITGGILLYTAKTHDAEVGVAVGPSSFSLAGRFEGF